MGGGHLSAAVVLCGSEDAGRRRRGKGRGARDVYLRVEGVQYIRLAALFPITTRLCLNRLKQARVVRSSPLDEQALYRFTTDTDNHHALENREWVSIVRLLAEGLSTKQRLVFTLCQLEGMPSAEVEQITGLDARQVKSNLYVARQTIRKRLKELGYE